VGLTYKTGSVSPVRWRDYPRYHRASCAIRWSHKTTSHRGGPVLISGLPCSRVSTKFLWNCRHPR